MGTKSRAPPSTSSISLGICWVMSREERRRGVTSALVSFWNIGSVRILVSVDRMGVGMDTSDGDRSASMPGIGVGSDLRSWMSVSSDGTLPEKK